MKGNTLALVDRRTLRKTSSACGPKDLKHAPLGYIRTILIKSNGPVQVQEHFQSMLHSAGLAAHAITPMLTAPAAGIIALQAANEMASTYEISRINIGYGIVSRAQTDSDTVSTQNVGHVLPG